MKNKRKFTLTVVVIFTIVLTVVGVTYAYWTLTKKQQGMNELVAACLDFQLTNAVEGKTAINLANAEPISVNEAYENDDNNYSFKVVNNCNDKINYFVALENLTPAANQISGESLVVSLDNKIYSAYNDLENTDPVDSNATDAKLLRYDSIDGRSEKTYSLGLFINKTSGLEDTGKSFSSKVFVTGGQVNTPKSKLTDDECFTIDANGTITDYDESCGKSVVIPATINDIKVKKVASNAFKKTQLSCGVGAKASYYSGENGRDFYMTIENPNDSKVRHTLDRAIKYSIDMDRYDSYASTIRNTENGFVIDAYNVNGPVSELLIKNPKYSVVTFMGKKYIAADSLENANTINKYLQGISNSNNVKAFIYENSYSYTDFASSFWVNSDGSSSYFVSDDMTFEQFKTTISEIDLTDILGFSLSDFTPTTIAKAQASSYLTNDYGSVVALKANDSSIYIESLQFVNASFSAQAGAYKYTASVEYVDAGELESDYDVITPIIYTYGNIQNKILMGQVNEEDVFEIYSKNDSEDNFIAVTSDDNIVSPIYVDDYGYADIIKESDFTSSMRSQYTKETDGLLFYEKDTSCFDTAKLVIDELDISNAVFLEEIESYAFSNLWHVPKNAIREIDNGSNNLPTYELGNYKGLKSLKMPRLAEDLLLGVSAFGGADLHDFVFYNNTLEFLDYALKNGSEEEVSDKFTELLSGVDCDGDLYFCIYGSFAAAKFDNIIMKDATGTHRTGIFTEFKSDGSKKSIYVNDKLFMETDSTTAAVFILLFAQLDMPFIGVDVDNVIYDSSIEAVGGQFVANIGTIVFPSNLKAWEAIITAYDSKNYDVIMNQSLNDFKNNVKITVLGVPENLEDLAGYSASRFKES